MHSYTNFFCDIKIRPRNLGGPAATGYYSDQWLTAHPRACFRGTGQVTTVQPGAVPGSRVPPPRCHRPQRSPLPPWRVTATSGSTARWLCRRESRGPLTQRGRLGIHRKRCHRNGRSYSSNELPSFQKWRKLLSSMCS